MPTATTSLFFDPADQLARHALSRVAQLLAADRDLDLVYTDEDRLDSEGQHSEPFFKPDWSPDYLLSWHYTGGLSVYRTVTLVPRTGGLPNRTRRERRLTTTLCVSAAPDARVGHVADVLYHARLISFRLHVQTGAARQAVARPPGRDEPAGPEVEPGPAPGLHRVRFALVGTPRVSILIPTTCAADRRPGRASSAIAACVQSIRWMTAYTSYEILVLNPGGIPDALRQELDDYGVRHLTDTAGGSNRAAMLNLGAAHATGAHLVFLEEAAPGWSHPIGWSAMLGAVARQADVGAVACETALPQWARAVWLWDPARRAVPVTVPSVAIRSTIAARPAALVVARNTSAVTGACLMTRTEVFRAVGGFTEAFPRCCFDVDYCLKVQEPRRRTSDGRHHCRSTIPHPDQSHRPDVFERARKAFLATLGSQATRDPFSQSAPGRLWLSDPV